MGPDESTDLNYTFARTTMLPPPAHAAEVHITSINPNPEGQQSLRLQHPVAVFGSREGSRIRMRHPQVSGTHCAIVNTGSHVLLRDLGSPKGTLLNGKAVNLEELSDGDLISVCCFRFRIGITYADSARSGAAGNGDLQTPMPWAFLDPVGEGEAAELARPVCTIGRLKFNDVSIAQSCVSRAHAMLFLLDGTPVLCDLISSAGSYVNQQRQALSFIGEGDTLRIGANEYHLRLCPSLRKRLKETVARCQQRSVSEPIMVKPVDPSASGSGLGLKPADRDSTTDERASELHDREQELHQREQAVKKKESGLEGFESELEGQLEEIQRGHQEVAELRRQQQATADELAQREKAVQDQQQQPSSNRPSSRPRPSLSNVLPRRLRWRIRSAVR